MAAAGLAVLAASLLASTPARAQTRAAEERALADLWSFHSAHSNQHALVVEQCAEVAKAGTATPFLPVVRSLHAWHLLAGGRVADAVKLFEQLRPAGTEPLEDPLEEAARTQARRWLSRVDLLRVREALERIYIRRVEYPATLEAATNAVKGLAFPLTDRWGRAWFYRPVDFKRLKGFKGQRYEIQCRATGVDSDLRTALARPYGARIELEPVRMVSSDGTRQAIEFKRGATGDTLILSNGTAEGETAFVYAGVALIVLTDGDHWAILKKPGAR